MVRDADGGRIRGRAYRGAAGGRAGAGAGALGGVRSRAGAAHAEHDDLQDEETLMLLLIDNYDSFTYNLYQYLGELGTEVEVVRNDAISAEELAAEPPTGLIISPGPGN